MTDNKLKIAFTLAEAAAVARCHPDTLRARCRSGELPYFRSTGLGKIRIMPDDLARLLKSEQKQKPRRQSA